MTANTKRRPAADDDEMEWALITIALNMKGLEDEWGLHMLACGAPEDRDCILKVAGDNLASSLEPQSRKPRQATAGRAGNPARKAAEMVSHAKRSSGRKFRRAKRRRNSIASQLPYNPDGHWTKPDLKEIILPGRENFAVIAVRKTIPRAGRGQHG